MNIQLQVQRLLQAQPGQTVNELRAQLHAPYMPVREAIADLHRIALQADVRPRARRWRLPPTNDMATRHALIDRDDDDDDRCSTNVPSAICAVIWHTYQYASSCGRYVSAIVRLQRPTRALLRCSCAAVDTSTAAVLNGSPAVETQ